MKGEIDNGPKERETIAAFSRRCDGVAKDGTNPLEGNRTDIVVTSFDPPGQSVGCTKIGKDGICGAARLGNRAPCIFLNPVSSFDNPISKEETDPLLFPTPARAAAAVIELGWENIPFNIKFREIRESIEPDRFIF